MRDDAVVTTIAILAILLICGGAVLGGILGDRQKQECRMELAKAGRAAEDIQKICK